MGLIVARGAAEMRRRQKAEGMLKIVARGAAEKAKGGGDGSDRGARSRGDAENTRISCARKYRGGGDAEVRGTRSRGDAEKAKGGGNAEDRGTRSRGETENTDNYRQLQQGDASFRYGEDFPDFR